MSDDTPNPPETSLIPNILSTGQAPQSMSVDGVTVSQQPIGNLIEGEKYVQGAGALTTRRFGLLTRQFKPSSALGDHRCR